MMVTLLLSKCISGGSLAEVSFGWTYRYSNVTMTWSEAREWCQTHYTDMVVVQSQDENAALVSFLPNKNHSPYYWLGITKTHKDRNWIWIGNNSTWVGEESWAENEPNNNQSWPVCVELYVNARANRGKWNDEKCQNAKYAVCYQAQCNATVCGRGRCQEAVNNVTCLFEGDACQTVAPVPPAVECPPLFHPNGYLRCAEGNHTLNSTCQVTCHPGFLRIGSAEVTCGMTAVWSGPRPACASYKFLVVVVGCGAFTFCCSGCMCISWMKSRKKQKPAQVRSAEEAARLSSELKE
ncbi:L-selectin-like isoform X1 [Phyllopteryx taeniolatus]|uniref:L-selectin-like isoform X1 n=1 Tax=Phyllopteryx taeniolatus TaxID=161469 RepID=UPI002AD53092|nr:L-selectin-like isoform X1 [Phyllopteryx taeniolatus]